jgi:hypothetical protein
MIMGTANAGTRRKASADHVESLPSLSIGYLSGMGEGVSQGCSPAIPIDSAYFLALWLWETWVGDRIESVSGIDTASSIHG